MEAFNYIAKLMEGLNSETALLEACDWDEKRADEVSSILVDCLATIASHANIEMSVIEELSSSLSENLSVRELDVCMEIIKKSIDTLYLSQPEKEEYEN